VVFCLAAALTVLCAIGVYGNRSSAARLVIQGREGRWVYPLERSARVDIAGPLGTTTVELQDKRVRVLASPCANQSCIASGVIHRRGQWLACLPNGVFVSVEGYGGGAASGGAGGEDEKTATGNDVDAALW
jgi:hypothetical protein